MSKSFKISVGIILILVALLTYLEASEPTPVNWAPSYTAIDKIPLGSYVFYESWKKSESHELDRVNLPPYEFLMDSTKVGTYFFLNDQINFDESELEKLLAWVAKGNQLFISSEFLGQKLSDTLGVEIASYIPKTDFKSIPEIRLVNPSLQNTKSYKFDKDFEVRYFKKIDTLHQRILGTLSIPADKTIQEEKVNFITQQFGKGNILLHTTPWAFSNYFMLSGENYQYAENLLAYIDIEQTVLLDNYYKSGKSFYTGPLYILLNNKSLKWAYYFALIGSVLFIIFEGKRKQRSIPVIKPLKNQTVEYTETIANLYLERKEYKKLAIKKISLFLEYIRIHYRVQTTTINEVFINTISERSGHPIAETQELFKRIKDINQQSEVSKASYFELTKAINNYKITNGK